MAADNRFITNLREGFKRGDIVTQLIYINVGVFIAVSLANLFLVLFKAGGGHWMNYLMFPASVTFGDAVHHPAVDAADLHVHARRHPPHPLQHAVALLVRAPVPGLLLCPSPARAVCAGGHCRGGALHAGVQPLPVFRGCGVFFVPWLPPSASPIIPCSSCSSARCGSST